MGVFLQQFSVRVGPIATQQTQKICITFVQRRPKRLWRWSNIVQMLFQMFCVYWVVLYSNQSQASRDIMIK